MYWKRTMIVLIVAGLSTMMLPVRPALATDFSFTGSLASDDDVALFFFTTSGVSNVIARSYGYAGGIQADGNVVPAGGFDPILTLFDGAGNIVLQQDDAGNDGYYVPPDPFTGNQYDVLISGVLPVGSYILAISQFSNFAVGPNLSNGFSEAGQPFFTAAYGCGNGQFCDASGYSRTSAWAFDFLNVETAVVPEPSTALLMAFGMLGLAATRRRN